MAGAGVSLVTGRGGIAGAPRTRPTRARWRDAIDDIDPGDRGALETHDRRRSTFDPHLGEQRVKLPAVAGGYAELLFVDTLWPDFDAETLSRALRWRANVVSEKLCERPSRALSAPPIAGPRRCRLP